MNNNKTLRPFFVRISGSPLTPIRLNAKHSIDAAKKIMLAQPELWRDAPKLTSVSVRDGELGPEKFYKCASVLAHFTAEEIQKCQSAHPAMTRAIAQQSLFDPPDEGEIPDGEDAL